MIRKHKSGRYGVRVHRGHRQYEWIGTFDNEWEALQAEERALLKPTAEVPTVKQWADIWLSDYPRPAAATQRTYRYAVNTITKLIGERKLDEITRPDARRIANRVPANTVYVARTMWADAMNDGVCDANPWTGLRLRGSRGRKDIDALTAAEIEKLAGFARDAHGDFGEEAAAIIMVLAYTTMRPCELCALKWSDIDYDREQITVVDSLDSLGNVKCRKKEEAAVIGLGPQVRAALKAIPRRVDDHLVFHSIEGKPLNKTNLDYLWRKVRERWVGSGEKYIVKYELRHAGITLLLEEGLDPATVAVQAGHRDGGRTIMRVYGHPSEDKARDRIRMALGSMASRARATEGDEAQEKAS